MSDLSQWPELSGPLIEYLKAVFPPKCKSPKESLETHMMYAGKVELVQAMVQNYEAQLSAKFDSDEALEDDATTRSIEVK